MARAVAIQVQCDRCKRVELRKATDEEKKTPDFIATFNGETIKYDDLDEPCKDTLKNVWKDLQSWNRQLTQRLVTDPPLDTIPPVSQPPDYTPPKPHAGLQPAKK